MRSMIFFAVFAYAYATLAGGWEEADLENEHVIQAKLFAADSINKASNSMHHLKLVEVHEAKQQVVAGMNYKFIIEMGYTVCRKSEIDFDDIDQCDLDAKKPAQLCEAVVYAPLYNEKLQLTNFYCA